MSGWIQDFRLAVRALASRWRYSLLVVVTMAVGIGATVGVWAYLRYFTRPTMDAPEPERMMWLVNATDESEWNYFELQDWWELAEVRERVFEDDVAQRLYSASMQAEETTVHVYGTAVSAGWFDLFDVRPVLGRLLQPADHVSSSPPVVVLSHLTWSRSFARDPEIVGETVLLDGTRPYTVVGVAPPGFQGTGVWTAVYTPLEHAGPLLSRDGSLGEQQVGALGRLQPEVTREQARDMLARASRGLDESRPLTEPRDPRLRPIDQFDEALANEPIFLAAKVLMGAVTLLLLLACANVANLLLAQGVARRREIATHTAIGAGRLRVARRLLLESLLLSGTGALLGLALVPPVLRLIESYLRLEIPVSMGDWGSGTTLIVNERELGWFVAGVSLLTGLLFGLAPVLQTLRLDLVAALKGDSGGARGRRWHARDVLVVVQVALSVALLVGAAQLGRTLWNLQASDLGFEERGLFLASFYLPKERLNRPEDGTRILRQLERRVGELPGVSAASLVWRVPVSFPANVKLEVGPGGERSTVRWNSVGHDYFETLGVSVLAGRGFRAEDDDDAPQIAVLNRRAAEQFFPDRQAVGQSLVLHHDGWEEPGETVEVVGVVADSRFEPPSRPLAPQVYLPFAQRPFSRSSVLVRAQGPVARPIRQLLRDEYPDLAVVNLVPFEEQLRRGMANQEMNAELSGGLAILGLLLAGFGIFSVMSYTVSQRTREIGIRMAIGAGRRDVGRWVLGEAMRRVALGLALGLAGAWAGARLLEGLLVGVEPRDPWSFVLVPLVLGLLALAAAWVPSRRATRVEPVVALRE